MKSALFAVMLFISSFANALTFHVVNDGEVGAYALGGSAAYENQGFANFEGPTLNAPFISNRATSGEFFSYGVHSAGEQVVFGNHVIDTNDWFYSIDSFNNDGLRHIQYSSITFEGTPVVLIGFEDLMGGGDLDFNDNVMMFTNVSVVPEPEVYMMLLVGLLLVSLGTLKRS